MKTLEITKANKPLSEYAKKLGNDLLVLTSDTVPITAVVNLKNVDWESISLSSNPEFMKIIKKSRKEFKMGKCLSHEEMEKEVLSKGSKQ